MKSISKILFIAASLPCALSAGDPLYELFREPTSEYRPFVRWWWNGARVTTEEAIRQLDVLDEAGFGGVEINTIAMPEYVDPATFSHAPELTWLGEEWSTTVASVARAADERGLAADIIIGSGWPFGGEFLEPSDQIKRIRVAKTRIQGPFSGTFRLSELAKRDDGREDHEDVNAIPPSSVEFPFLRLISEADDPGAGSFGTELLQEVSNGEIALDLPAGEYSLVLGITETGYTQVKSGAPGAKGPVLDHFNKSAVSKYLGRMAERMTQHIGPDWNELFRATFVDSLELDHSNWSDDFEREFEQRRGYAVAPYLPFVLDDERQDGISRRARYDFCKTLIELFDERFSQTYIEWCARNGLGSRMQAYGRETHPLHGSMGPTHPEGETWLWHDERDRPRIFVDSSAVNKYVSSAARLSGKRTVSFEAMTNAVPVFRESLGDFKRALDLTLQDGPNHPIIHGFNYTPIEAGFPGWVRFGSYLNERTPFWSRMGRFNDYAARLGAVLRNSDYQAQIAVLAPRAEEWERVGLLYQPFPETINPWYQYRLPVALQKLGFGVDFVSEELIASAEVRGDELDINGRRYKAVILEDVSALALPAAQALRRFSDARGKIAFVGTVPERESGLSGDWEDRSDRVKKLFSGSLAPTTRIFPAPKEPKNHTHATEPGVRGAPFDDSALIAYLADLTGTLGLEPEVSVMEPSPWLSLIHHRADDHRAFVFVSNSSDSEWVEAKLDTDNLPPAAELWDPESGDRYRLPAGGGSPLALPLPPLHSALLVFGFEPSPAPVFNENSLEADQTLDLSRDWQLELRPAGGLPAFGRALERVGDLSLSEDPQLRDFSGEVIYRKTIELAEPVERARLSLGAINGTSRLFVDGREMGVKWYGNHNYFLEALPAGEHVIEIEVTTTLGNLVRSMEDNPASRRWAFWFNPIETGIIGPVSLDTQTADGPGQE